MQSVWSTQGFPRLGPSDFALSDTISYSSYSSGTTIWGPGTLAGKFVLSFGKATLRTAENLVIFHRLAAISRQVPFRDNDDLIDIETTCKDIVELTRPALYPRRYRLKALELVIRQLAAQQTYHLAAALSKLHFHELVKVLTELMIICMLPDTNALHPKLSQKYSELLRAGFSVDPSLPCVNLFAQIAQQRTVGFAAVLETGFLEVFLWICLRLKVNLDGNLIPSAFSEAINVFSYPPEDLREAWMAKIHHVVPFETTNAPLLVQVLDTLYDRERVKNMGVISHENASPSSDTGTLLDIGDLLPFCSINRIWDQRSSLPCRACSVLDVSSSCEGCLKARCTSHLFIQSILVGGEMKQTISSFLSRRSHKVKVSVILRIFYNILLKGSDMNKEIESLLLMFDRSASTNSTLVAELLTEFASDSSEWWEAMTDAALLAILPFFKSDIKAYKISDDIAFRTWHGFWWQTLPMAYSSYTTKILRSIRTDGLWQVLETRDADVKNELCDILGPVFRAHRMSLHTVVNIPS